MVSKITILHLITQGNPWGGAQKYVYDISTNLSTDFCILVAIGKNDGKTDLQKKLENKGTTVLTLKHLRRKISPIHDMLAIFEISRLYKKVKPDIIHLHSSKAGILGSFARIIIRKRVPIIYTAHGWVFNENIFILKKWLYTFLEKITAIVKTKIIVLSEQDRNSALSRLNANPKKLTVIPPGVLTHGTQEPTHQLRKKLGTLSKSNLSKKHFVLGTIANFYPTKGLDILVRSVEKIQTKIPELRVYIIGEGPEYDKIRTIIKKKNLEKIIHTPGFIPDATQFLPIFDACVIPSYKEGLPYALLEALMYSTPVIATRVGGIPSVVIHKKTGLLIEAGSEKELSNALLYSYNNPKEMKKCGHGGQKLAMNKYSLNKMLKNITSLYESILLDVGKNS